MKNRQSILMLITHPVRWALACLLFFCFIVVSYLSGITASMDQLILQTVSGWQTPFWTYALEHLTVVGDGLILAPVGIIIVLLFYVFHFRQEALALLVTIVGCEGISEGLKAAFARARPVGFHLIELPDSYSMPSGHATVGAVFFTLCVIFLFQRIPYALFRFLLAGIGGIFIILLCASRIYLGVHYPTDVLAGYFLGMTWLFAVYSLYSRQVTYVAERKKVAGAPYDLTE